jgi:hypothetical protein
MESGQTVAKEDALLLRGLLNGLAESLSFGL